MQGEGRRGIGPVDQFSPERVEPRLHRGLRESGVDGVREAFKAVYYPAVVCLQTMRGHHGDQDIFDAAVAQAVHHRQPELGSLIVGNPCVGKTAHWTVFQPSLPQNLAFPFWRYG